jgi:hypothetical protein
MDSRYLVLILSCLALSCNNSSQVQNTTESSGVDSVKLTDLKDDPVDTVSEPEIDMNNEMAMYFVVIADTSYNYYDLRSDLVHSAKKLKLEIDSLDRFYNSKTRKIQLPDDSEDEIYAGEYYPRRFNSESLSIEYANQYLENLNDSLMAGIMGIYVEQSEAEKRLQLIRKYNPKAFVVKSELFQGCMH